MSSDTSSHKRKFKLEQAGNSVLFVVVEMNIDEVKKQWFVESKKRLTKLPKNLPLCVRPHPSKDTEDMIYKYCLAPCGSLQDLRGEPSKDVPEYTKDQLTIILIVLYHGAVALDALHKEHCHRNLGPGSFLIWKKNENGQNMFIGAIGDMAAVRPIKEHPQATTTRCQPWTAPDIAKLIRKKEDQREYESDIPELFKEITRFQFGDLYSFGWDILYMFTKNEDGQELSLDGQGSGLKRLERVLKKIVATCMDEVPEKRTIKPYEIAQMIKIGVESAIADQAERINPELWKASTHPANFGFRHWECTLDEIRSGLETRDDSGKRVFENAWKRFRDTPGCPAELKS